MGKINTQANYHYLSDKTRIYYQIHGPHYSPKKKNQAKGPLPPLIVLNYGLVCGFHHWKYLSPYLQSHDYNFLQYNYRGHFNSTGLKTLLASDRPFQLLASDLAELLSFFGDPPVILIGHSMGVNTTLEYTKLNPERVKGLILISGSVIPPQMTMFNTTLVDFFIPYLRKLQTRFPHIFKQIWQNSALNPLVQHLTRWGGFNLQTVDLNYIQTYLLKTGVLSPELFFHLLEAMAQHDIISHLELYSQSTLIIGGNRDKVFPKKYQEILATKMPRAQTLYLQGAGHVPQIEYPQTVNEKIGNFLNSLLTQ